MQRSAILCAEEMFGDEDFYFQNNGIPSPYYCNVRAYLDVIIQTHGLVEEVVLNALSIPQTAHQWDFFYRILQR